MSYREVCEMDYQSYINQGYIDPRIVRTKSLLKQSLLSLIREKDFRKITITEITQRAGLARPTFYLHYETKEDLLLEVFNDFLEPIHKEFSELLREKPHDVNTRVELFVKLLRRLSENKPLMKASMQSGYVGLLQKDGETVIRKFIIQLQDYYHVEIPEPVFEIIVQYIVGGYTKLVTQWLFSKDAIDPYLIGRLYIQMNAYMYDYLFKAGGLDELVQSERVS